MFSLSRLVAVLWMLQVIIVILLLTKRDYIFPLVSLPLSMVVAPIILVNIIAGLRLSNQFKLLIWLWSILLIMMSFIDFGVLFTKVMGDKTSSSSATIEDIIICSQNTAGVSFRYREFWDLVHKQDCDVVLLQEVWSYMPDDLILLPLSGLEFDDISLDSVYPYFKRFQEFVFLSRFPLKIEYMSLYEGFAVASVKLHNKEIKLINVHLWTPLHKRRLNTFLKPELFSVGGDFVAPNIVRRLQITEFLEYLSRNQGDQTIIIGDFNTLPHNVLVREIVIAGYRKFGSLIAYPTFSRQSPIIMIDHAFGKGVRLNSISRVFHDYSDHALLKVVVE